MRPTEAVSLLRETRVPVRLCASSSFSSPVLALGGTRTWRDVLDDLDVRGCESWWSGTARGFVHCGIAARTRRLLESNEDLLSILDTRDEEEGEGRRGVILVGWSLGGGVGVCLASQLEAMGLARVHEVHAFGAPRVGDAGFLRDYHARGLADRTFLYATPRDPVPHVLLSRGRYKHAGRRVRVPCDRAHAWEHHDLSAYAHGLKMLEEEASRSE